MRAKDLEIGGVYRVADRAMAFGNAAAATNAAKMVAFLPKPERPPYGGHPLNVEIEWIDEDLPTREARVAQRVRMKRQSLAQTFERKSMDPPTEAELSEIEAEVQAFSDDKLGRFRGMRQKVYSGQIVEAQADWLVGQERTAASKEAHLAGVREADERLRERLIPLLADAPADLRSRLLDQREHLKGNSRTDLDYEDLIHLLEATHGR